MHFPPVQNKIVHGSSFTDITDLSLHRDLVQVKVYIMSACENVRLTGNEREPSYVYLQR